MVSAAPAAAAPGLSWATRRAFCVIGPVSGGAFAIACVRISRTFCLTCVVNSCALSPGPPAVLMPRTPLSREIRIVKRTGKKN
jgi:hypothetical protein